MPRKVKLIGNTAWGYCFTPIEFDNVTKAKEYGIKMKGDGYWFAYRII